MKKTLEETIQSVKSRLRILREQRGIIMADIAASFPVAQSAYHKLEKGPTVPSVEHLYKAARALNVSITDFFTEQKVTKFSLLLTPEEESLILAVRGHEVVRTFGLLEYMFNLETEKYGRPSKPAWHRTATGGSNGTSNGTSDR